MFESLNDLIDKSFSGSSSKVISGSMTKVFCFCSMAEEVITPFSF